jgi:UDP-N-acetylmuramoylalanine--D-glutamate ligase
VAFTARDFPGGPTKLGHGSPSNLAAAFLVAIECGVKPEVAIHTLQKADSLPHRQQSLGTHQGIVWVNDSASTTPQSTLATLDALEAETDTIIVGGLDRGYDFTDLGARLAHSHIRNIVLFPDTGRTIREAIEKSSPSEKLYFETSVMDEAVAFARKHTRQGRVCLLSNGSPSYNLFENYPARGEAFGRAVSNLTD